MNFIRQIGLLLVVGLAVLNCNGMKNDNQEKSIIVNDDRVSQIEVIPDSEFSQVALSEKALLLEYDKDAGPLTFKEKVISYSGTTICVVTTVGLTLLGSYFPTYYIDDKIVSLAVATACSLSGSFVGFGSSIGFCYWFQRYVTNRRNKMNFVIEGSGKV